MQTDALIGVQDMGAAGLTCSTSEMGARGGSGIEIDVSRVPQRETGMTPYEIMLSESQERMLLVVKKGREAEVEAIFEKWDLHAAHIGDVMNDGILRVRNRGEVVAEIPNGPLVDEAPVYNRPVARPAYLDAVTRLDVSALPDTTSPRDAFLAILGSPTVASKRWVYRQYRPHGADQLARAGRDGRGRRSHQGDEARAGDVDRRQWALLLPEPAPRGDAGARRGGAQCGLRGRPADRRHELPELRQPRAAGDHVAVRRGGRGSGRRVPRARHSDHRRQRQPLQRNRRSGDLPDAHHRRRRLDRGRRARRVAHVQGAPATRSCCSARVMASLAAAST